MFWYLNTHSGYLKLLQHLQHLFRLSVRLPFCSAPVVAFSALLYANTMGKSEKRENMKLWINYLCEKSTDEKRKWKCNSKWMFFLLNWNRDLMVTRMQKRKKLQWKLIQFSLIGLSCKVVAIKTKIIIHIYCNKIYFLLLVIFKERNKVKCIVSTINSG